MFINAMYRMSTIFHKTLAHLYMISHEVFWAIVCFLLLVAYVLEDNAALRETMATKDVPKREYHKIEVADGFGKSAISHHSVSSLSHLCI